MLTGVTQGYKFKMRFAYAHFPIQGVVSNGGDVVEIKNFVGEKVTRRIDALPTVKISRTDEEKGRVKEEILLIVFFRIDMHKNYT